MRRPELYILITAKNATYMWFLTLVSFVQDFSSNQNLLFLSSIHLHFSLAINPLMCYWSEPLIGSRHDLIISRVSWLDILKCTTLCFVVIFHSTRRYYCFSRCDWLIWFLHNAYAMLTPGFSALKLVLIYLSKLGHTRWISSSSSSSLSLRQLTWPELQCRHGFCFYLSYCFETTKTTLFIDCFDLGGACRGEEGFFFCSCLGKFSSLQEEEGDRMVYLLVILRNLLRSSFQEEEGDWLFGSRNFLSFSHLAIRHMGGRSIFP